MPLTTYTAGEVLTAASLNANLDFAALGEIAIFNESQATNTNGGTFTAGSFVKRVLNTTVVNTIPSCTLTSSVISLVAGTYLVVASAPAFQCNSHQTRLQNTTAATTIQLGSTEHSGSGDVTTNRSIIQALFTLTATSNIELQHRCSNTAATQGLGVSANFGNDVVYAQIQILAVA
jgi:hypothetical protein